MVKAKGEADYQALISHYQLMQRTAKQAVYVDRLWEHLCHMILPRATQGGFQLEGLSGQRKGKRIIKEPISVECGDAATMANVVKAGKYFQPTASNFPVIDAAVEEEGVFYGLQMTVASSHPSSASHTAALLEKMPNLQLVWVVDSTQKTHIKAAQGFEYSATEKSDATLQAKLSNVPQWLLVLDFPKTNPFLINQ